MTAYIIIRPDVIPALVLVGFISLTILGIAIGHIIEQEHRYKDAK